MGIVPELEGVFSSTESLPVRVGFGSVSRFSSRNRYTNSGYPKSVEIIGIGVLLGARITDEINGDLDYCGQWPTESLTVSPRGRLFKPSLNRLAKYHQILTHTRAAPALF